MVLKLAQDGKAMDVTFSELRTALKPGATIAIDLRAKFRKPIPHRTYKIVSAGYWHDSKSQFKFHFDVVGTGTEEHSVKSGMLNLNFWVFKDDHSRRRLRGSGDYDLRHDRYRSHSKYFNPKIAQSITVYPSKLQPQRKNSAAVAMSPLGF